MATYVPAAPGTYALRIDGDRESRRTVVCWMVGPKGAQPLVASADIELTRDWFHNAAAVEHPDGMVESLVDGRCWLKWTDWIEEALP